MLFGRDAYMLYSHTDYKMAQVVAKLDLYSKLYQDKIYLTNNRTRYIIYGTTHA